MKLKLWVKQLLSILVTRIEGHAKISIYLDDQGKVDNAGFHVVQYRGFQKFCQVKYTINFFHQLNLTGV
ncbi:hypothetical protein Sta7437_2268 [Stanieria cyanosphaera PCC 7437]|uniref:Uncharacterized protein n=1 Tax=Stanieria cyanosphaera (strain ATCC 29371 / PCC 7437) TaxID=111780 RepID=K9XVW4_STAC7|nr:hypothetical protein [Stanieria cyanosphaera]AFZ35812.1 hypothetical protein Sta7437_2268 [Stanieria cyanosphaera PCC 7437]